MIPFAFATGNRGCPSGAALRSVCTAPRCLCPSVLSQAVPRLFPLGRAPAPEQALPCSSEPPGSPGGASRFRLPPSPGPSVSWPLRARPFHLRFPFRSLRVSPPVPSRFAPHRLRWRPVLSVLLLPSQTAVNLRTLTTAQLQRVSLSGVHANFLHWSLLNQALGLLVPPSCTCYHASTDGLSTRSSPGGLTSF